MFLSLKLKPSCWSFFLVLFSYRPHMEICLSDGFNNSTCCRKKNRKKSVLRGCLNLAVKYIILLSNCFYSMTILVSLLLFSSYY